MTNALDIAVKAARAGGLILAHHYREGRFRVHAKSDSSLLTTADEESEHQIIKIIKAAFPDHAIKSEEQEVSTSGSSLYRWLIDPLDGTENFVLGIPFFSISIALCEGGVPVTAVIYNPIADHLYTAEKGRGALFNGNAIRVSKNEELKRSRIFFIPDIKTKRRQNTLRLREALYTKCRRLLDTWAPALDWCLVASGRADGIVIVSSEQVRANAGTLILEEAGGISTDFQNVRIGNNTSDHLIVSNGTRLHDEMFQLVGQHFRE